MDGRPPWRAENQTRDGWMDGIKGTKKEERKLLDVCTHKNTKTDPLTSLVFHFIFVLPEKEEASLSLLSLYTHTAKV